MTEEYADSLAEVQEEKGIVGKALMDSLEEVSSNVWIDYIREDYHQRTGWWGEQYK